jgi:3-dehydrosphinganine reductase
MKNFANKLVYITGGSSGIGLAAAREFLKDGASVLLISRSKDKLIDAAEILSMNIGSETKGRINLCPLDITEYDKVQNVIADQLINIGVPDIVFNCAGMAHPDYFEKISYHEYEKTISTNLTGTWNILSALVPFMKMDSHIINTSSIGGFVGVFGFTAYSASKFAVMGLSEALRGEMRSKRIHVSVLCPPDTDTPGMVVENKTKPKETHAISGNVRLMSSEEVAKALIKGIQRRKFIIIPGAMGKFTFLMKRLFPSLVFAIMDNDVKKINSTREK